MNSIDSHLCLQLWSRRCSPWIELIFFQEIQLCDRILPRHKLQQGFRSICIFVIIGQLHTAVSGLFRCYQILLLLPCMNSELVHEGHMKSSAVWHLLLHLVRSKGGLGVTDCIWGHCAKTETQCLLLCCFIFMIHSFACSSLFTLKSQKLILQHLQINCAIN